MTTGDVDTVCWKPPQGWYCTRLEGHDGPCAAVPDPRVSKDEHVKCETYTEYKQCFGLYKEQSQAISDWKRKHDTDKHMRLGQTHRYAGAIGGAYTYEFTRTSIGQCVHVKCACGEGIDVSDYDNW